MTVHFPSTIVKLTADGTQALSSYLDKGETLLDGTTYEQVTGTDNAVEDVTEDVTEPDVTEPDVTEPDVTEVETAADSDPDGE